VGNAGQPRQRPPPAGHPGDLPGMPVDDGKAIIRAGHVPGCGGAERFGDRISAGAGSSQQYLAAYGRPRRLTGQPAALGALVESGNYPWSGEVFGGDVEGVKVAGRGGAEPDGGILLLPLYVLADCGEASRARICSSISVAVRR
jgi:hypothetical protein